MNPTLIKANIALFNGSRAEARRLLRDYQAQEAGAPDPDEATQVLWLTAQAQDSRDARVEGLRSLLETAPANDPYARLASQYLADEQKAEVAAKTNTVSEDGESAPPKRGGILGVPLWKAGAFALAGIIVGVIVMTLVGGGRTSGGTAVAQIPTSPPVADGTRPAGTPAPDLSTPIPPELHQTDYPRGILQVSRIEDGSQRIADQRGNPVTPVEGARFVALKLLFECRGGICQNPPEADMFLFLDDSSPALRMGDVGVVGEDLLQPVAQGRTTDGWVVFEVPDARQPLALAVLPNEPVATPEDNQEPEALFITLVDGQVEVTPDDNP